MSGLIWDSNVFDRGRLARAGRPARPKSPPARFFDRGRPIGRRLRESWRRCSAEVSTRGVAQPGLARLLGVQEVAGSNPVAPILTTSDNHCQTTSKPLQSRGFCRFWSACPLPFEVTE